MKRFFGEARLELSARIRVKRKPYMVQLCKNIFEFPLVSGRKKEETFQLIAHQQVVVVVLFPFLAQFCLTCSCPTFGDSQIDKATKSLLHLHR